MKNFLVHMLSKRRYYDVAEIFYSHNILSGLVTDFYSKNKLRKLSSYFSASFISQLGQYYNSAIPDNLCSGSIIDGFYFRFLLKNEKYRANAYEKSNLRLVRRSEKLIKNKNVETVYSYDNNAKEVFEVAKKYGKKTVLEQCIAPRQAHLKMLERFKTDFNINVESEIENARLMQAREEAEWAMSDLIVCPSQYVRENLLLAGVPDKKIKIVPYGFELRGCDFDKNELIDKRVNKNCDFKILFVGNSSLRKGIHDLNSIADYFKDQNVEFRIAGMVDKEILALVGITENSNVKILGSLGKQQLYKEFLQADIFILPSYLEGSAMVILEALNFLLPIITTYESGSFIENNKNGFVTKAGDVDFMVKTIESLIENPKSRKNIAQGALKLAEKSSLTNYTANLINAINDY